MDDLSEKLANILNDPESLEKVRKVAESFLGQNEAEAPKTAPSDDFGLNFGVEEFGSIISILGRLKNSGNDPRTQLLQSLKPHLSEPKREKVDTAIKILKLIDIFPLIKDSGILKF